MAGYEPWKNPADFVYHYTSTAGLMGILSSKKVWLTDAGFLNDTEELTYGARRTAVRLREQAVKQKGLTSQKNSDYVISTLQSIADSIERINEPNTARFEFPSVACFSMSRDDLSQWRGYASDGYCVAFHRESLRTHMVPDGVVLGAGQNIPMLMDISYGNDAEVLIDEQISLMISALHDHGPGAAPSGVENYYLIKQLIVPILVLIKHPAFAMEREVRMYLINPGSTKFRASKLGPVPYTQVGFEKEAVAEVMVAPGSNAERRAQAAQVFLDAHNYASVHVTSSTAPFVG